MTATSKAILKGYFNAGDRPTEAQFADLIDSLQQQAMIDVRDFASSGAGAIQAALNEAVSLGSGRVYIPGGTYKPTAALYLLNQSNIEIFGDGMGRTIIDLSDTPNPTAPTYGDVWYGGISILSNVHLGFTENVHLHDFTLKMSTDGAVGAHVYSILFNEWKHCSVRRVRVEGGVNEGIVGIGRVHDATEVSDDLAIVDCEVTGFGYSGININNCFSTNNFIANNYIHDSQRGLTSGIAIEAVGYSTIIANNRIDRCLKGGIFYNNDGPDLQVQDVLIIGNMIRNIGGTELTEHIGINIKSSAGVADGGILVSNNVISYMDSRSASTTIGIRARGACTLKNNVLRGCYGVDGYGIAIYDVETHGGYGEPIVIVDGNVLESVADADARFAIGIFVENDADVRAVMINNIVQTYAVRAGWWAFYDLAGNSTIERCMLNGHINHGANYNLAGELNDQFISNADFINQTARCNLYATGTAQSIPYNAFTSVALNAERIDTDAMHDNATNNTRITFKTPGTYLIIARVIWSGTTGGRLIASIFLNGATQLVQDEQVPLAGGSTHCLVTQYKFALNDYVEFQLYQSAVGGGLSITNTALEFSAVRVGD